MKSVKVRKFGDDINNVTICEEKKPRPGKNQVLIRMKMSVVNPSDINYIEGNYYNALDEMIWNIDSKLQSFDPNRKSIHPEPPFTLGGEGTGVVEESGGGMLANFLVGKRVALAGKPPNGLWQEYVVADAQKTITVPDSMPAHNAASYFINPITSVALVSDVLKVKKGDWLIQNAAGSEVAKSIIKMSKIYGYKTINVIRDGKHSDDLKSLGADLVVETDTKCLFEEVRKATNNMGCNYALDCIGGKATNDIIKCLSQHGKLAIYGSLANQDLAIHPRHLMMKNAVIEGFYLGEWLEKRTTFQMVRTLKKIKTLASKGVFDTKVDNIFPIDSIKEAIRASTRRGRKGKVLISWSSSDLN